MLSIYMFSPNFRLMWKRLVFPLAELVVSTNWKPLSHEVSYSQISLCKVYLSVVTSIILYLAHWSQASIDRLPLDMRDLLNVFLRFGTFPTVIGNRYSI